VSQIPPNDGPFIPPPPPTTDSLYPPDVLASKQAEAASDAKNALIMSIIGIFCLGIILGFLALRKANNALEIMNIYQVAQEKRGMATTAKVIAIIDMVLWAVGLIARFALN
jgi:hypothetical protein